MEKKTEIDVFPSDEAWLPHHVVLMVPETFEADEHDRVEIAGRNFTVHPVLSGEYGLEVGQAMVSQDWDRVFPARAVVRRPLPRARRIRITRKGLYPEDSPFHFLSEVNDKPLYEGQCIVQQHSIAHVHELEPAEERKGKRCALVGFYTRVEECE